ncbi:MAG: phage virion morphogenesis protein [Brevundimonas sp.]|uniref:phage virion morphogenesis protein n=1 Tax=Brevundimonas sp. TaxID=1871086 RepID=UPI00391A4200
MAEDLQQLHSVASSMLEFLEPRVRARLLRTLARDLRTGNQRRQARQVGPDGEAWEKRKARAEQAPASRATRFLYPSGGGGEPRLVDMRSWRGNGTYLIGFDREADGLRTFRKDKVIRYITAEGAAEPGGMPPRAGQRRIKAQAMFRGLRSARWQKAGADGDGAWVQFAGRAARIAAIHHHGGRDRVTPGGPEADYPERRLLGFGANDEAMVINRFIDAAGDALGWGRRAGR